MTSSDYGGAQAQLLCTCAQVLSFLNGDLNRAEEREQPSWMPCRDHEICRGIRDVACVRAGALILDPEPGRPSPTCHAPSSQLAGFQTGGSAARLGLGMVSDQ